MKKINSGAISARTCKSTGLCTESAARGGLSSPCYSIQGSKDKPAITGTGLQELLPLGWKKILLHKTEEPNQGLICNQLGVSNLKHSYELYDPP